MFSSIMKTKTRPGDYLAILGAGGGLGHMYIPDPAFRNSKLCFLIKNISCRGIQIAAKKGLRVIAIDRYVKCRVEHLQLLVKQTNLAVPPKRR